VVQVVEDLDDLVVDLDAVGDVGLAAEHARDGLGEARLPVARRAVEEQRAARVHRGPQLVEQILGDGEVRQAHQQIIPADDGVLLGLLGDEGIVLLDGHRGGAHVGGAGERVARVLAALPGEDELHRGAAEALSAAQNPQLLRGD